MIKFIKTNLCFILIGLIVLIVLALMANAINEGIDRIITQENINDTYRIHE